MPLALLPSGLPDAVRSGFTTRAGGVSAPPYDSLDLGLHVEDDPARVRTNRERVSRWAGGPLHLPQQVHGPGVAVVDAAAVGSADLLGTGATGVDALVTDVAGTVLGALGADCVPVLFADADAGVVAVAHAGRRGLVAGVLQQTLDAMSTLGAERGRVHVSLGPAAGGCCYEVPATMRDEVEAAAPGSGGTTTWGTSSVDLRRGASALLADLGVVDVRTVGPCTIEDPAFFSYRRDGRTGRHGGVVVCPPRRRQGR